MSFFKKKHSRSKKSGAGAEPPESAGLRDAGMIVVWDLDTCGIQGDWQLDQVRNMIRRAIGCQNATFHIFCADSTVRERMQHHCPNEVVTDLPPDVSEIGATADPKPHVLFITGNVEFCQTVSMLRQHNLTVGVVYPRSHPNMLKWVACYALDWKNVAIGNRVVLNEPRYQKIMGGDDCNMNPIYIYWDLRTCKMPDDILKSETLARLTEIFQNVLRSHNYWGRFKIFAYGHYNSTKMIIREAFHANFISFQPLPEGGSKIDATKMILDHVQLMLHECHCSSCFMLISDGDLRSAAQSVKWQAEHKLIHVKSRASSFRCENSDVTLEWPDILVREE